MPPDEAELAWQDDNDFSREAAFLHVGAGLLTGDGLAKLGGSDETVTRLGRNLLTEAEHGAAMRQGGELLERAEREPGDSADAIARLGKDDHGVAYLRDNAAALADELGTRQAKAAQTLLDSYGQLGKLKPTEKELSARIPDGKQIEQARWVAGAKQEAAALLDGLPAHVAKPLLKRINAIGEGGKPAAWFERASDISDDLMRLRATAADEPELASGLDALDSVQRLIGEGLGDARLWGEAATTETNRSSNYARRVADHLAAFESHFTSRVGAERRADPGKFSAHIQGEDDADRQRSIDATLEAARATADAAGKFGKGEQAKRILDSVDELELTGRQARTLRAARGNAPSGAAPAQSALDWMSGGTAPDADAAERSGVYRALHAFSKGAESSAALAARRLLTGAASAGKRPQPVAAGLRIAAPAQPAVTALNFDAVRDHLDKMASDPRYFAEVVGASFGRLPQVAPEVFGAISEQTARTVNYLAAVAPGGKGGGPFAQRIPVSEDELWEFQQRLGAASDPEFIAREIGNGGVTSQAVESLQATQPARYFRLQLAVYDRLQELTAEGIPVPSSAREHLDVLLDLDGGGDPAMTWQVAERAEAGAQAHRQRLTMPKQGSPSGAMSSGALNTLGNGAAKAG
jgi:hypothetical protein